MEKYILKFYSNFSNPDVYKKIYERLCQTHLLDFYGPDKKVYITNGDDYTHIIILNTAMPNIPQHICKENVIGLSFEPNVYLGLNDRFINYVQKYVGKYFIGDASNLPKPFYEHYAYMMHITPLNYIPQKPKLMSIIFSEKQQQVGHKYRHILVSRILEEKLPIDIYGRGCKKYSQINHPHIKGHFENNEPYEDYQFHIAIENVRLNHYFSEKITNTLLCSTVPIYLGCKNIESYFPDQVLHLTGNIDEDIITIKEILKNPEKYKKNISINEIKNKISLINNIDSVFVN